MENDDNEDGCAFEETQTPRTLTECFETLAREAKGDLYLVLFLIERPTLLYFVNRLLFFFILFHRIYNYIYAFKFAKRLLKKKQINLKSGHLLFMPVVLCRLLENCWFLAESFRCD